MNIRVKIRNNQYVITSDRHQYILQREIIVESGKDKGKKRLIEPLYHKELHNLLESLYKMEQRQSDVDNFRDLIKESQKLSQIFEEIKAMLKLPV